MLRLTLTCCYDTRGCVEHYLPSPSERSGSAAFVNYRRFDLRASHSSLVSFLFLFPKVRWHVLPFLVGTWRKTLQYFPYPLHTSARFAASPSAIFSLSPRSPPHDQHVLRPLLRLCFCEPEITGLLSLFLVFPRTNHFLSLSVREGPAARFFFLGFSSALWSLFHPSPCRALDSFKQALLARLNKVILSFGPCFPGERFCTSW